MVLGPVASLSEIHAIDSLLSYECSSSSSDSWEESEAERRLKIRAMGKNRVLANAF